MVISERELPVQAPVRTPVVPAPLPGVPSAKQQSWGVVISIVVIVGMIVVGAFYAWGKRIAEERVLDTQTGLYNF